MRPIDADELEKSLENYSNNHGLINAFVEFLNVVDEIHTLNVKPVVHGRWVSYPHQIDRECSICGHTEPYKFADKDAEIFNFCPHCGADMRKEQSNV